MQPAPAALRIHQSVATLAGADDSLEAINTSQLTQGCVVYVQDVGFYRLDRLSVAVVASPNIIAPAQGGPGRWLFLGSGGATFFQEVLVTYGGMGTGATTDAAFLIPGVTDDNDIVEYNLLDTPLPAGLVTGPMRVTGVGSASLRFANVGATVVSATVAFRMAVLKA